MKDRYLTTTIAAAIMVMCAAPQAFAQSAPANNGTNPPQFRFDLNGQPGQGFSSSAGLDFETEVIEYREGSSPTYHKTKQPGLAKYGNVTLKRGTFSNTQLGNYRFDPD